MIITRTPLRMSFAGGGSDMAGFYRKFGGAVVSTAIDKYIYVTVNKKFDDSIRLSYSKTELVKSVEDIEHSLVAASMKHLNLKGGIEITTIADIPSKGTGLGSSSSFTVGLLHALHAYGGTYASAERLGEEACHIEIDVCKAPIGKQDQYAAAFGGFNLIQFMPDDRVEISPLICPKKVFKEIESNILLFYTGITRNASDLLKKQTAVVEENRSKQKTLRQMTKLAFQLKDEIQAGNVEAFGHILHENWMLKRGLVEDISSSDIDDWYKRARKAGAIGGKILGAGGGGFLMLFAPLDSHDKIKKSLSDLRLIPVGLERQGSRVIFIE